MNLDFVHTQIRELQTTLANISTNGSDIAQFEAAIVACLEHHASVKEYIAKNEFQDTAQEIHFFKELKPQITSKHIYFLKLYGIHSKMPIGSNNLIKEYLQTELTKIDNFYKNNIEFCRYYSSNSCYNDELYFLRGSFKVRLDLDQSYLDLDKSFNTSHGFKAARIIAHRDIKIYVDQLLRRIDRPTLTIPTESQLEWSGSKTDLVELIYGLQESGIIKSDINTIAQHFQSIFTIDLGDFYKTWTEIRARKKDKTKLFSKIIVDLNNRIENYD